MKAEIQRKQKFNVNRNLMKTEIQRTQKFKENRN